MRVVNMKTANMKQQKGFTLIELIIVIIILGILAVTAAPKFLDVQQDAQESAISGIAGAVRSASQIAHSANLINDGGTVELEDETYVMSDTYLVAGEVCRIIGLLTVAQTATAATVSSDGAYTCNYTVGVSGTSSAEVSIYPGTTATTTCTVVYTDNLDDNDGAPTITTNTTDC